MASQTGVVVTLDGQTLAADQPLLYADDLAAVRGDGVFETLLVRLGGACLVQAHLERLTHSAKLMDLPEPEIGRWRWAIEAAVGRWSARTADEGAMRLVYSRGRESGSAPTAYVTVNPVAGRVADARREGVAAITLARGLPVAGADALPWLVTGAKTLSYAVNMAALRHAARQGAGDVIFVSSDGYILEGPRSTVVIATDLAGTTGPADTAAVVSDPARHYPAGAFSGRPRQRLRLRLPRAAAFGPCGGARDLVGVEHDAGCAGAHPGRTSAAAHPDGGGICRARRRRCRQRSLNSVVAVRPERYRRRYTSKEVVRELLASWTCEVAAR